MNRSRRYTDANKYTNDARESAASAASKRSCGSNRALEQFRRQVLFDIFFAVEFFPGAGA